MNHHRAPLLSLFVAAVGLCGCSQPRGVHRPVIAPVASAPAAQDNTPPAPVPLQPPVAKAPPVPPSPIAEPARGLREGFPHVRVDAQSGIVEFDGTVPIDAHNPRTPDVYLELIACTRDTKEHEALVMTDARPSHIHAALLLAGATPGKPGFWDWTGEALKSTSPTGDSVDVSFRTSRNGRRVEEPASMWVTRITDGALLPAIDTSGHWVFAGSREVVRQGRTWYEADGSGTLIGLTTFGGETLGWTTMYNPDSGVQENVWIANRELVPPFRTEVTVVLTLRRN